MPAYRFKFKKGGDLRFISHLDTSHAFERAARRAGIPLAFTQGFHPHPKIAFATALAVGTTSEAEYVDIETIAPVKIVELMKALNTALPEGMQLVEGLQLANGAKALMSMVSLAEYRVVLRMPEGMEPDALKSAVTRLLGMEKVSVRKRTKSGIKDVDIAPFITGVDVSDSGDSALGGQRIVNMVLACGSTGMAKPEDVLEALRAHCGLEGVAMVSSHRTGLFHTRDGKNLDLLEG